MYNLYRLFKVAYAENKLLHGVDRTHGRGVPEETIQQEVKSKKNRTKCEEK